MYNTAGFDGYLVKPVSGAALEDTLIRHIAEEKLNRKNVAKRMSGDISASSGYVRKLPVAITCTSMCDIPDEIVKKLHIPVLPFCVRTDKGIFKDGVQMGADELIRYINAGKSAVSSPPDVDSYTDFFANVLKNSHHLIHIAITTSMSEDYRRASEAAEAFDNVTVINSECLSSTSGLLVLIAYKLIQKDISVEELVTELETVKKRLQCSFVIDTTEYMAKKGLLSQNVNKIAQSFGIHPGIRFREDKFGIGNIWMGSTKHAYKKYIRRAFPVDIIPDSDIAFITYVDIPEEVLLWIREEISKIAFFEHIVFKQASAAISSNCGSGTFGILYFVKGNISYNIGSFFEEEPEDVVDEPEEVEEQAVEDGAEEEMPEERNETEKVEMADDPDGTGTAIVADSMWYGNIKGIDADAGVKNSGSEESFQTVLRIFYDSIHAKSEELENYYESGDLKNYTIKIHALKSSAKLIGAAELSEAAYALEMAGKEGNTEYIKEHHAAFMDAYLKYQEILAEIYEKEDEEDKPVADANLIASVYEALKEAAEMMDCVTMENVFEEISAFSLPEGEREKFAAIKERAEDFDYEAILQMLEQN